MSLLTADIYSCSPKRIFDYVKGESLAFWCVCAYLFFEYVRPQSIYTWIDFFPWAAFLLVASFCFSFTEKAKVQPNPVSKIMGGYGVVVIFSTVFAVWPRLAFDNLDAFFQWLLVFFVIVRIINTRERFFIFLLLYLLCNFKMSQHGFLSWMLRGFSFANWGVAGAPGWFSNSGELGIQMTIFTPLAVAFVAGLKDKWGKGKKIFFYLMPFTGVGTIVASSSRGAMLGLLGSMLWRLKSSKYFIKAIIIMSLLVCVVYMVTPVEFKERLMASGEDNTSMHRLDRWEAGWATALKYPFWGVGHKNWDQYFRQYLDFGVRGSAKIHNIFMESLTEHGFIGFFTFILLVFYMLVLNKRSRAIANKRGLPFELSVSYGLDAGLIGMLVSSSFVTVLYYPYVWVHAAFVVSLYNSLSSKACYEGKVAL